MLHSREIAELQQLLLYPLSVWDKERAAIWGQVQKHKAEVDRCYAKLEKARGLETATQNANGVLAWIECMSAEIMESFVGLDFWTALHAHSLSKARAGSLINARMKLAGVAKQYYELVGFVDPRWTFSNIEAKIEESKTELLKQNARLYELSNLLAIPWQSIQTGVADLAHSEKAMADAVTFYPALKNTLFRICKLLAELKYAQERRDECFHTYAECFQSWGTKELQFEWGHRRKELQKTQILLNQQHQGWSIFAVNPFRMILAAEEKFGSTITLNIEALLMRRRTAALALDRVAEQAAQKEDLTRTIEASDRITPTLNSDKQVETAITPYDPHAAVQLEPHVGIREKTLLYKNPAQSKWMDLPLDEATGSLPG